MKPPVKAIFFDLGGTLVTQNIENNLVTSKALREITTILPKKVSQNELWRPYAQGYRINQAMRSRHHVEIPIETWMYRLLRKALGLDPPPRIVKRAIRIVVSARAANTLTFSDSRYVMAALKRTRVMLGALSNVSSHEVALAILAKAGIRKYFDEIVTSARIGIRKPDPAIFRSALARFDLRPGEAVIVGDSEHHDIEGGYAVGLRTVLIDRKGETDKTLADYRFPSLAAALPTLESL